jgi:hypothetical protein
MHPPTARILIAAIALIALAWATPASPANIPDANSIGCPNAPSGWTLPTGSTGRYVISPNPTEATQIGGDLPVDNEVNLSCTYFNSDNRPLIVNTSYALPSDLNPWWDFDFGCTSVNHVPGYLPVTGFPWDTQHRVYFVLSSKSWSYAEFQDPYDVLSSHDVGPFETIANSLLSAAQPAAHNCQLAGGGQPAPVTPPWQFHFSMSATNNDVTLSGQARGSFLTGPSATSKTGVIGQLEVTDIQLTAKAKGSERTQKLTIRVGAPISFRAFYTDTLKAEISVVSSSYPACPKGSTGVITLSSNPSPAVVLDICNGLVPAGATEQTAVSITNL